jgi:flagellar basal body-associated protein FliL
VKVCIGCKDGWNLNTESHTCEEIQSKTILIVVIIVVAVVALGVVVFFCQKKIRAKKLSTVF